MRITNNMLINNVISYIGTNLSRMNKYQGQLATGKKIQVPSDDPIVAARALKLRTDVAEVEQYQRNVKDAQSWLEMTEDTLAKIGDILQRARELAVQTANGTLTQDETQKVRQEIVQLKNQIIHMGNATYAGRYIFSGFKTNTKFLNDDGTFAIDVSNSEMIKYEIGIGDDININVPGGDLFNADTAATSGNTGKLIDDFNVFIAALDAGDNAAISNIIAEIDDDLNNILRVRADVGARINRVELTANRLDSDEINFKKLMSENEDADITEVIIRLKNEENVYTASLGTGARIIMPTLIDFLK